MTVVVDTNVPMVASKRHPAASPLCVANCVSAVRSIMHGTPLVLDDQWHIIGEYRQQLSKLDAQSVGYEFLAYILQNRTVLDRCCFVRITPQDESYAEFPGASELAGFDRSDRKFAAVARAHPDHPPVLNAVDSDWWHFREVLDRYNVHVDFVCPDYEFRQL